MASLPNDPPHILKAEEAAAAQGLDLTAAFTALNLAAQFYRESQPELEQRAARLERVLKRIRGRVRLLKEALALDTVSESKKLKKVRFHVDLLLPAKPAPAAEQPQPEPATA